MRRPNRSDSALSGSTTQRQRAGGRGHRPAGLAGRHAEAGGDRGQQRLGGVEEGEGRDSGGEEREAHPAVAGAAGGHGAAGAGDDGDGAEASTGWWTPRYEREACFEGRPPLFHASNARNRDNRSTGASTQLSSARLSPNRYEEDMPVTASAARPRLAYFAAVARHEHVTRAAHELGVPQSTLSPGHGPARTGPGRRRCSPARAVRSRSPRPAAPSCASAERALAEVDRAADSVRADADPAAGKVAFGFLHTLGSETVPGLIRGFRADHPRVRFQLVQNYGEAMIERLRAGGLDLCLTSPVPDAPDLVARRLDEQRLRLVVPDDHRLAAAQAHPPRRGRRRRRS